MTTLLLGSLTVLVWGLAVGSTPVQHTTSSSSLHRPRANNSTSLHVETLFIFDPTYAIQERKNTLDKYINAEQFLNGVGLPNDPYPEASYPDSSSIDLSAMDPVTYAQSSSDDPASGIIGMPPFSPETVQMPLTDFISGSLDVLYHGPMTFGSQAQELNINIDTGSADLWVPVKCNDCTNLEFASRRSSTFRGSASKCGVTYGTGKVAGTLAQDTVSVGRASVAQQSFCAVHKVSDDFNNYPNSGLLGMAFGAISQTGKPTFFENLLKQQKLSDSIFSVHLTRKKETGSQVCFGCIDPTKMMGPIQWINLVSRTYWSIAMDGLSVNTSTESVNAPLTVAVDTGTSLIYVPQAIATNLYALIPGSAASMEYAGFYTIPCYPPVSVSLNLSGQTYAINPLDFKLGRKEEGSDDCYGGILAMGEGFPDNLVILGDEFLKSWYSVYDYSGRVGFAPSINNR